MNVDDTDRLLQHIAYGAINYPGTILGEVDGPSYIKRYVEIFKMNEANLFDDVTDMHTRLNIRDYGDMRDASLRRKDKCETENTVNGVSFSHFIIPDIEQLRNRIVRGEPARRDQVIPDPKCRFILLSTSNAESRLLCLTKEMLFMLLTYHQVSPCYLHFIACLTSPTGPRGFSVGSSRGPHMDPFRRSGKHYQFAFRLHGMVSLDKGQHKWRQHTAAIYHHFDVQTGSALWMLTAPLDQPGKSKRKNFLWERVKKHIHHESGGVTGFKITHEEGYERFRGSLQVIAAIVEWSLEDCSVYAHELSERITGVNSMWLQSFFWGGDDSDSGNIEAMTKDLRQMNSIMSDIQALSNRLKDNPPVLKSIIDFYSKEINQHQDSLLCGEDGQSVRPEVRDAVDSLRLRLQAALQDTQEVIKQVRHLESLAHMKEDLVQRLLQNRQNREMQRITEATLKDSSAMRQFSLITLILLPITVVSTVLSTDIVKFQGLSRNDDTISNLDNTHMSKDPVYRFSPAAFGTWAVSGLLLTLACLAFSTKAWLPQRALHFRDRYNHNDSSSSIGSEAGDDTASTAKSTKTRTRTKSVSPPIVRPTGPIPQLSQSQSPPVSPTTLVGSTQPPSPTVARSTALAQTSTNSEAALAQHQSYRQDSYAASVGDGLLHRAHRLWQTVQALVTRRRGATDEHEMGVV